MNEPTTIRSRGRPRRHADLEYLRDHRPANCGKRPHYVRGVGLLHGNRGITAYLKIRLSSGKSKEFKVGDLSSWSFDQLDDRRRELQGRADRGEPLEEQQKVLFSDHAQCWLNRKKQTARGFGTLRGHVLRHLNPTFGKQFLTDLTVTDINKWVAAQRQLNFKPATVNRQLSTLNAILNDAVKAAAIGRNPAKLADKVAGATARQRFLTEDEINHVLAVATKIEALDDTQSTVTPQQIRGWLRDFVLWALHSGMRRGEIIALKLTDVVTVSPELTVVLIATSKNGQSRTINATSEMINIAARLRCRSRFLGDERLFPLSLATLKRKLTRLWTETGLKDVRLHDMRRTNATILCQAGVDMRTLAGRLGHSNTNMLMKTYAVYQAGGDATNRTNSALSKFS